MTQQHVAETASLSLNSIKALESGKGKLSSLIAVLRELNALDSLDAFLPDVPVSPLQLARSQGKKRQRASGNRIQGPTGETAEW